MFSNKAKIQFEELWDTEVGPIVEITIYPERGSAYRVAIPMEEWQELKDGLHPSSFTTQQRGPGVPPEHWERWPNTDEEFEIWKNGQYRD